jgi:hypothetical protein
VQLILRITPSRLLAVSGWASVAEASDLGAERELIDDGQRAVPQCQAS